LLIELDELLVREHPSSIRREHAVAVIVVVLVVCYLERSQDLREVYIFIFFANCVSLESSYLADSLTIGAESCN
jgi:hypothetical protein